MILPYRLFGMTAEKGQPGKERDKRWRSVFLSFFLEMFFFLKEVEVRLLFYKCIFSQVPAVKVLELGRP